MTVSGWVLVAANAYCNPHVERFILWSPGQYKGSGTPPSLGDCQKGCEGDSECKSISFKQVDSASTACYFFSTPCTNTASDAGTVAWRKG